MRSALPLILAAACLGGCGSDCVIPPCAEPDAIVLSVTSASGAAIANATVHVTAPYDANVPCASSCHITGNGGHYELDVSAPGFATVHRSLDVSQQVPRCGCVQVDTQTLTVTLSPTVKAARASTHAAR